MNFLRRELAPIGHEAWNEIDSMARKALKANLAGRKFVDVDGPHGLGHACVPLGRLSVPETHNGAGVRYGIHQVLPLVETRVPFRLQMWELDNLERGARDIDLEAVVDACREIAAFEDKAVFEGFDAAGIAGLQQATRDHRIPVALDKDSLVDAVSEAQTQMLKNGVEGGADLVVSEPLWKLLARSAPGGTLRATIEEQIGGRVLLSALANDALLVANRGGDLTLTVGQDFAIGYHSQTSSEINLFITESFTFRIIAPEALVGFSLTKKK